MSRVVSSNRHRLPYNGPAPTLGGGVDAFAGFEGRRKYKRRRMYAFLAEHPNGKALSGLDQVRTFYDRCQLDARRFSRTYTEQRRDRLLKEGKLAESMNEQSVTAIRKHRLKTVKEVESTIGMTLAEFDQLHLDYRARREIERMLIMDDDLKTPVPNNHVISHFLEVFGQSFNFTRGLVFQSNVRLYAQGRLKVGIDLLSVTHQRVSSVPLLQKMDHSVRDIAEFGQRGR